MKFATIKRFPRSPSQQVSRDFPLNTLPYNTTNTTAEAEVDPDNMLRKFSFLLVASALVLAAAMADKEDKKTEPQQPDSKDYSECAKMVNK